MKFNEKYCELEERVEIIKISNGNVEIVGEIRRKYFKYRTKYFCPLWRAIERSGNSKFRLSLLMETLENMTLCTFTSYFLLKDP